MELIETDATTAASLIEAKTRVIKAQSKYGAKTLCKVRYFNLSNLTFSMQTGPNSTALCDCEDFNFFIVVPKGAKTVY